MGIPPEYIAVALAAASIFTMGGVIFGIASLYPVLYYERALESSSCGMPAMDDAGQACALRGQEQCCDAQQLKYTSITSAALFAADGAMLAYGELGDRLGPRACFGTGASLAWLGLTLLALGAHTGADTLWYAALLCIGISGPGVFMGCLFLGERYPQLHAVISAVGAAMWDASALVFQIFALTYFSTVPAEGHELPSLSLTTIALGWLCLTVTLGLLTFRFLPSRALLEQMRAAEPSSQPLTQTEDAPGSEKKAGAGGAGSAPMSLAGPNDGTSAPPSFVSVFCRTDTRLILTFMGLFNLKSSFYIATFATQMRGMFYAPTAESLSSTFNFAFPVGGFFTSVVGSILLDRLGEREDLYMTLVVLLAIMFGLYNLLPYAASQFASALLFGPTRTLQWACYFHFLSLPRRYPPQFVGRLLGYGNLIIALVGDVPLSALNAFVLYTDVLGSESARYVLVHFVLQLAIVGCLALPWYLHKQHLVSRGRTRTGTDVMDVLPGATRARADLAGPYGVMDDDDEDAAAAPRKLDGGAKGNGGAGDGASDELGAAAAFAPAAAATADAPMAAQASPRGNFAADMD